MFLSITLLPLKQTREQKNTIDRNTHFIIDDKDKELFTQMKLIVDSGFPPMEDPMLIAMDDMLHAKKRKYGYTEYQDEEGYTKRVYIRFPRWSIVDHISYYIRRLFKTHDGREEAEA